MSESSDGRLSRLGALLRSRVRVRLSADSTGEREDDGRTVRNHRYARMIAYLRGIPLVLAVVFVGSLFWDFPERSLTIGTYEFAMEGLLRTVSVAGLIGFGTNWLAIRMLFRPRRPRPILGQGLLPAQRERIARRMASTISERLINETHVEERLSNRGLTRRYRREAVRLSEDVVDDPEIRSELRALMRDRIEALMERPAVRDGLVDAALRGLEEEENRKGLSGLALRAYRYFNEDELRQRIRDGVERLSNHTDGLLDEIDRRIDRLPDWLEEHADRIERTVTEAVVQVVRHLDLEQLVLENIRRFDERELERVLVATSDEQLNYIKYLGGLLGCVGGLLIWQPLPALAVLGGLTGSILLIDELWMRWTNTPNAPESPSPTPSSP